MEFRLRLVVGDIEQLPPGKHASLMAVVEWRGSEKKAKFMSRVVEKSHTCQQRVQENGRVSWNEGFDHICRFNKRGRSERLRSWIVVLQIEEVEGGKEKTKKIGKVKLNVAEFVQNEKEKVIRIPINCKIGGHTSQAIFMVKLQLFKLEPTDRNVETLNPSFNARSTKGMKRRQRSLARLFTCTQVRGEDDDIGNEGRRRKSCIPITRIKQAKVRPEEIFHQLETGEKLKFKPGCWRRRKIVSRDEKMELVADVFLASIDQSSKRAAGGSACTVLAAVVADWLHNNPKSLPAQRQFDELVIKGSSEWRKLCADETNKVKFANNHFDLDTVLEEKVKSLAVINEKSCVGFFTMDEVPHGFECMQGDMSFDSIWNAVLCNDEAEEKIYIASWNDHFFVLKVEADAIYLLDTLGRRLLNGCNQAYILKFDADSVIYKHGKAEEDEVAKGIGCCKEYIKGFLSAIPLSGLQQEIKRGKARLELLHRLLQIDFHFTAPCSEKA